MSTALSKFKWQLAGAANESSALLLACKLPIFAPQWRQLEACGESALFGPELVSRDKNNQRQA